jgi:hypothetical protein
MSSIAEKIYESVKSLPDNKAGEVLDFVEALKNKQVQEQQSRKADALATLAKYRGRFNADSFNRDDLYDR